MIKSLPAELCEKASAIIRSGFDGFSLAEQLTSVVDEIIVSSFMEVGEGAGHMGFSAMALLAVGGYGRKEMMPFSDIDIMLLSKGDSKDVKEAVQAVLYRMWDRGLNISHSFRTLKGCVDESMKDLHTRTTLMDCRFLAGNEGVFSDFKTDVYQKLLFKGKRNFTSELIRDIERRHKASGDSLYLLEPNIKEGRGALRDVNSMSWLSRSELKIGSMDGYRQFLPDHQFTGFLSAFRFLLKTRACIHVCSGRKNDVMSAEFHDDVASMMGFKDTSKFFSSEILMRVLYHKLKTVSDALKKVINLCGKRYFNFPAPFLIKKINDDFNLSRNEIIIKNHDLLQDTSKIMEAFYIYSTTGKEFSFQAEESLKFRAVFIGRHGRSSCQAISYFWEILKGNRVFETLMKMQETGVLGRFMPEFGRLRHLIILESFHKYTVDEHTLLAIRNIENLKVTKHERLRYLSEILKKVNQEVLYISILLHDIGKGVSKKHEDAGYIIIKGILERLSADQHDRRMIEFLVAKHIFLSKLAMTRDIDAPETVAQLAEVVENQEKLDLLYLMTYADMSAVNTSFWNEWKASILHELYTRTSNHLGGIRSNHHLMLDNRLRPFSEQMSERYIIANTPDEIRADYELYKKAKKETMAVSIEEKDGLAAEITVVTHKTPRLFSRIVGTLSSRGLNIVSARLFTGNRGVVVRKIVVSNWRQLFWEGMEKSVVEDLRKAIMFNEEIVPNLAADVRRPDRRFEFFLEMENETSDQYTILEVMVPDRIGLLYSISTVLYTHNIDILTAVINTDGGTAHDVFYLQRQGGKLTLEDFLQVMSSLGAAKPDAG